MASVGAGAGGRLLPVNPFALARRDPGGQTSARRPRDTKGRDAVLGFTMRRLALLLATIAACSRSAPRARAEAPRPEAADALGGPCVDPATDARRRLGSDAADGELRVERVVDLDGDGVDDPFVAHPAFCGTGGCQWQLYVARGACARWVGELFAIWPLPGSSKSHGLMDLDLAVRKGCAGAARTESRARFDGSRYVVTETRECHCPEPAPEGSQGDESEPSEGSCDDWTPLEQPAPPP